MIITLGRNKPNGKTAAVVEKGEDGKIYLTTYKQRNGLSAFNKAVESIILDDERVKDIVVYYNRLK